MTRSTLDTGMCETLPEESAPINCSSCGANREDCRRDCNTPGGLSCCARCDHVITVRDVEGKLQW